MPKMALKNGYIFHCTHPTRTPGIGMCISVLSVTQSDRNRTESKQVLDQNPRLRVRL